MDDKEKIIELEWLLDELRGRRDAYLLEHVMEAKPYAAEEIHEWARNGNVEVVRLYRKIRELLKLRVIETEMLDRSIKLKYLGAFEG